jgi:hypothetical protein
MRVAALGAVLVCSLVCALAPAHAADGERGRVLYEARCDLCHRTSVHVREARKATTFEALRAQVARWNMELGGAWSRDEINDVTVYLNSRYYFFPCPESACGNGQAKADLGRATALSGK